MSSSIFIALLCGVLGILVGGTFLAGKLYGKLGVLVLWAGILSTAVLGVGRQKQVLDSERGSSALGGENARDLTAEIQEHRERIERLEGRFAQEGARLNRQFSDLEAKRKALQPADAAAVGQFNQEVAAYQQQNAALKQMQRALELARQELDGLLAERSKHAASGSGTAGSASGRKVVMYTTATCPACRAAKQYFAQKGVSYREIDVTQSPAGLQEFQRLGGRGVPLIVVDDKRVEGFNPQQLDSML
jgi:glutaredoxin-like YruB-family protein